MNSTTLRYGAATLLFAVAVLAALLVAATSATRAAPASRPNAVEAAQTLAAAAAPSSLNDGKYLLTLEEIKSHAAVYSASLPLPAIDSLDDLGLFSAADQGGTSTALLEFVIQHNLACDWYAAALGTNDPARADEAKRVIAQIPAWPAFREGPIGGASHARARQVAEEVSAGVDNASLKYEVSGPACNPVAARVIKK